MDDESAIQNNMVILKCPRKLGAMNKYKHDPSIPTFREFVLYLSVLILNCHADGECKDEVDIHLLPQMHLCNPCILSLDYWIKVGL